VPPRLAATLSAPSPPRSGHRPCRFPPPQHPPPSFKAETARGMAPLGHHHRRIVWSPPSPLAPIKGTRATTTTRLHRRRLAAVARQLRRRSVSGEGTAASLSPSSAPRDNCRQAVAPVRRAPTGAPPRSQLHRRNPPWTEAGRGHGL
jgi:hypothetical protein